MQTFDFVPAILAIGCQTGNYTFGVAVIVASVCGFQTDSARINGSPLSYVGGLGSKVNNNTVMWWNLNSVVYQFNTSGSVYTYVAIGA